MPSRIAGRLITGPFAFLLGGIIDVSSFALASLRARRGRRARARRAGARRAGGSSPAD